MLLIRLPYGKWKLLLPKEDVRVYYETLVAGQYNSLRIREGDYVLDAGAGIGDFTVVASDAAGPSGRVAALEPDPTYYSILRRNLTINKITNCYPSWAALAAGTGKALLHGRRLSAHGIEVPTLTIGGLLTSLALSHFDVVKLDIEGSEKEVFRESSWMLNVRDIAVETHGGTYWPVLRTLAREGFKTHIYNKRDLITNTLLFVFNHPLDLFRAEAHSSFTALRYLLSYAKQPPGIVTMSNPWVRLIHARRQEGLE